MYYSTQRYKTIKMDKNKFIKMGGSGESISSSNDSNLSKSSESVTTMSDVIPSTIPSYFSKPRVALVLITFSLNLLPILLLSPMAPLIILKAAGDDNSKAALWSGVVNSLGSLCSLFAAPILGVFSDKFGRKPFILLSVISVAISLTGYLLVYYTNSLWILIISYSCSGITSTLWGMCFSYVADISTHEDRARSFGYLGAGAGFAAIVGPAIGGGIGSKYGYSIGIFIGLGVAAADLIFTFFCLPESLRFKKEKLESKKLNQRIITWKRMNWFRHFSLVMRNRLVMGMCFIYFINQITTFGIISSSILYYKERFGWSTLQIGLSLSAFGISIMIVQGLLIRPVTKYLGERKAILAAILLSALSTFPYGLLTNGYYLFIIIPFRSTATIAAPLIQGLVSKQYNEKIQGKVLGCLASIATFAGFIGPITFSALYSYFESDRAPRHFPQIIFFVSSGLQLLAFIVGCLVFSLIPEKSVELPSSQIIETKRFDNGEQAIEIVDIKVEQSEVKRDHINPISSV